MQKFFLVAMILSFSNMQAEELDEIVKIDPELSVIRNGDAFVVEALEKATDTFLEGYIQALIDLTYYEYNVSVLVRDHRVVLYDLPNNELTAKSIIAFVQDLPGVISVIAGQDHLEKTSISRRSYAETSLVSSGVWFPQATISFLPIIGSPREPVYSVNYRYNDSVMGRHVAAVSLGDDFPIFRWYGAFHWKGDLQIGISAGIWAVFNYDDVFQNPGYYCRMMNADYLVGLPITYAVDRWSFRLRLYHISGHLGDECIVDAPNFLKERKNPSLEALDCTCSYQFSSGLRVYGGPGLILQSDPSFELKPLYFMWGSEVRLLGQKLHYHRLYGTPFFAIHVENWQQHSFDCDTTIKFGYEISKLQGVGRKMRIYFQYHQGYSCEGQFFNQPVKYGEFGFSWGF